MDHAVYRPTLTAEQTGWYKKLDANTFAAYEQYVMAPFRFGSDAEVDEHRRKAIESLIPGTLHYFHLYFLDLAKRGVTEERFDSEQAKMFAKFEKKHGTTPEFAEIDCWFSFIQKVENGGSTQDMDLATQVAEYLQEALDNVKPISEQVTLHAPEWLHDATETSSQSGEENQGKAQKQCTSCNLSQGYDRQKRIDQIYEKYVKSKKLTELHKLANLENEIDWTKFSPAAAFEYAQWLISNEWGNQYAKSLYEVTSESFFS